MTLSQIVESEKRRLLKEKRRLEKLISRSPEGDLIYSTSRSKGKQYYKWFVSKSQGSKKVRVYIPQSDRRLAQALARKHLYQKKLEDTLRELDALDAYLKKHRADSDIKRLVELPAIGALLAQDDPALPVSMDQELYKWMHAKYERNPKHPEHLTVKTVDGNYVRSKSEALIYMLLLNYNIAFRYECRLDVGGYIYYPDFTIRHPVTGEIFYWEHVGRLDKPDKVADFLQRLRVYMGNGILPDHNLILTYESEGHPLDFSIVQHKMEEFFNCSGKPLY